VQYIDDLLDELGQLLCIDTSHVFSTGMSNGGQMSSLLACRLADRVTAVAPVSGVEWNEGCDGEPVPVMAFHGDADPIVTFDGGGLNANRIADLQFYKGNLPEDLPTNPGVFETLALWADHNGCRPEPVEEQVTDEVLRYEWEGCTAPTTLYVVQGAGHSWPGRPMPEFEEQFGPGTTDIDATALMFELFLGPPDS
jgi:polyhydroxybutyrate depolymerase